MPAHTIDFRQDLPTIREYLSSRVKTQANVEKPVSAIEIGFQLCQWGQVLVHFDTREGHKRDGTWTLALDGPTLKVKHWCKAYEAAGRKGISFVLFDGETQSIKAGSDDEKVADLFGTVLLAIARDAIATGTFEPLTVSDKCQLDIEEFDGMWAWPAKYEDCGKTNLIGKMKTVKLPK
jgi:hypothetical protein